MFKIGEKVICKNKEGFATSSPYGIEINKVYTIEAISKCACGKEILHLLEAEKLKRWCGTKDIYTGHNAGFYSYRFEKVNYEIISNKEIIKNIISTEQDVFQEQVMFN
tara:strand:- start:424 stop:747 length:324 start_codon:yes stop_codon:yes gene_type:complete